MLQDKIALITGATKSNGFRMAALFSRLAASLIVNRRTPEEVDEALRLSLPIRARLRRDTPPL